MKLLLIDSNESSIRVCQDVFESWGFTVTTCSHAGKFEEITNRGDILDVIISELDLPGIKRGKLISVLKETFPDSPIIVLTNHHSVSSAVQAIKNGASEFILKPFEMEKLREIIFKILTPKNIVSDNCGFSHFEPKFSEFRQSFNQTIDRFVQFNQNLQLCDFLHRESCEHISEALLMLDKNQNVILINNKMQNLLGLHKNQLTGRPIFRNFPEFKNTLFYSIFKNYAENGETSEYKNREFLRPFDNQLFELDLKVIAIKSNSNISSLLGMIFIGVKINKNMKEKISA